jgi:TonB family protein
VIAAFVVKEINLNLTIGKTGKIDDVGFLSKITPSDSAVVNTIINEFPNFQPALLEGAPVRSTQELKLVLSNQGLQIQHYADYQTAVNENDSLDNLDYTLVEELPEFPGGDIALRRLIAQTVRYPQEAQEEGIQGKVYVNFVIQKDGSVANIKIAMGVHPTLDAEAIRVVKQMNGWKPGRQKGKPVRVSYTVPINFVLN